VASNAVVWSVNGVAHGNATTGAISVSGLYTPATSIWAGHSVSVSATATAAPGSSGSINVKIVNPLPVVTSVTLLFTAPGSYLLDVNGSNFFPTSQLVVAGVNVATTYVSTTELESNITLPAGTISVKAGVLNPNAGQSAPVSQTLTVPAGPRASIAQATRLLDQATFGPTLSDTQHVQLVGMPVYLTEQFATPATLMPPIPNPPVALCPDATYRCAQHYFWKNALTANDQLRQRVAFALSEIFVVSTNEVNARSIPSFQNVLAKDAFTNFQQIMTDVTLTLRWAHT